MRCGWTPRAWGGTPVFAYGFDDFTPLELDALETLAGRVGVDVVVSLPYEPGRLAFKAVDRVHARLAEIASEADALPPAADWYADESARRPPPPRAGAVRRPAVRARSTPAAPCAATAPAAQRAEVELVAAEVLGLLREGTAPGDVAVVFRDPARYGSLVEQVFGAYGIPFSIDRHARLGHTGLGRGLLALLRCATDDEAGADDLLAWLRTPGRLEIPELADRLEADVRQAGVEDLASARARWDAAQPPGAGRARPPDPRPRERDRAAGGARVGPRHAVRRPLPAQGAPARGRGAGRRPRAAAPPPTRSGRCAPWPRRGCR